MAWYMAEIKGSGFMIDGGCRVPDEKTIHYVFEAENNEEASRKARVFAESCEARSRFWMTDPSPKIELFAFIDKKPQREYARLAD